MSIIKIKKRNNPYVQIDKGCLDDPKLSWQAKGVLCYLLSKPEDWKPRIEDIIKKGTDGKKAVYNTIKELIASGYVIKEPIRKHGRIISFEYTVYELPVNAKDHDEEEEKQPLKHSEPFTQKGEVVIEHSEPFTPFLQVEKLQVEKGTYSNIEEGSNKEKNNKEVEKKKKSRPAFSDLVKQDLDQLEPEFKATWDKYQDWYNKQEFEYVPKIKNQLTPRQLQTLIEKHSSKEVIGKILVIENACDKYTKNKSVYLTLSNWFQMYPA